MLALMKFWAKHLSSQAGCIARAPGSAPSELLHLQHQQRLVGSEGTISPLRYFSNECSAKANTRAAWRRIKPQLG
jgi:hypothetical protein